MKKISIIIPAYNEEDCVEELVKRLRSVFEKETKYEFETVLVENGSTDATFELMKKVIGDDKRFKIIKLSRNFRMDGGLTAGLEHITGDACVWMTADLQDPPENISMFIREWENGYKNVYGIVSKRVGTKLIRKINSNIFYFVANILTGNQIPRNVSDFRLLDKTAYLAIRSMKERNRFLRGLAAWVGFKSKGIPMERPPRFGGQSNASTFKVIDLAVKGIFAYSNIPLRFMMFIGAFFMFASVFIIFPLSIFWIIKGVPFAGFGTLISLVLILFGILSFMIGILSEYIGLIYEEVKKRPSFIVDETIN
jgi:polyisoprenyl-phosphate glycosyltransferase